MYARSDGIANSQLLVDVRKNEAAICLIYIYQLCQDTPYYIATILVNHKLILEPILSRTTSMFWSIVLQKTREMPSVNAYERVCTTHVLRDGYMGSNPQVFADPHRTTLYSQSPQGKVFCNRFFLLHSFLHWITIGVLPVRM